MSRRLPVVKANQVVKVAEHLGFQFRRQRGSHAIYVRAIDSARVVIPMHAGRTLKPKTLQGIVHDLKVSVDEFRGLL